MKKNIIGVFAALVLSTSAHAGQVLNCTTPGDALEAVTVTENSRGSAILSIGTPDGESEKYIVTSDLSKVKKNRADSIVAAKNPDAVYGGGTADAVLLSMASGGKSGILAARGYVFVLVCTKL